ncbi:hypothetical protein HKX48_002957, partial [Thoreauomyces humboldtii]
MAPRNQTLSDEALARHLQEEFNDYETGDGDFWDQDEGGQWGGNSDDGDFVLAKNGKSKKQTKK